MVSGAVRIGLRKQPVLRDRVFTVVLAAALLHGGYLVYPNHGMIDSIFVFCGYFVCRFMHLSLVVTLLSILYNVKGFSCLPSPDSVHFLLLRNGDSRGSIFKCASTGAFWCSVSFFLDKRCTDLISMMQKASHNLKVAHGSVEDEHAFVASCDSLHLEGLLHLDIVQFCAFRRM